MARPRDVFDLRKEDAPTTQPRPKSAPGGPSKPPRRPQTASRYRGQGMSMTAMANSPFPYSRESASPINDVADMPYRQPGTRPSTAGSRPRSGVSTGEGESPSAQDEFGFSPSSLVNPPRRFTSSSRQTVTQPIVMLNTTRYGEKEGLDSYWLYGFVEYKLDDANELGNKARKKSLRIIDKLVGDLKKEATENQRKGQLLFDIISTHKHILSGAPQELAHEIYRYVDHNYYEYVTTTFVGLTDNTARRVARDVFCRDPCLSKTKYQFDVIDDIHMHIIYPQLEARGQNDPTLVSAGFHSNSVARGIPFSRPAPAIQGRSAEEGREEASRRGMNGTGVPDARRRQIQKKYTTQTPTAGPGARSLTPRREGNK